MAIYGIDLGTTNSIIGLGDKLSVMVPSVANLKTGAAGASEYGNYSAMRNYKVDMQTSKSGTAAIVSSTCVLRELKRKFGLDSNKVIDAVISVPAYFGGDQCQATIQAAKEACINVRSIIKEPTAAAIFLRKNKDGIATIFDLGGGTLDVSVIRMSGGKAVVLATDGCILGGRDLDREIGQYLKEKYGLPTIAIPDGYDTFMSSIKVKRCSSVKPLTFDLPFGLKTADGKTRVSFNLGEYCSLVLKVFSRAADIAKSAIRASGVDKKDMSFYFVGGSTHCPILRTYIEYALGIKAEKCDYDRDMAVAAGAVYYADLLDKNLVSEHIQDASKLLSVAIDNSIFTQPLIYKNTGLPATSTTAILLGKSVLKQSYVVDLFYGDCSMNVDSPENNNKCIRTVTVTLPTVPTSVEETVLLVTSTLSESGSLSVKFRVPLCGPICIEEEILL